MAENSSSIIAALSENIFQAFSPDLSFILTLAKTAGIIFIIYMVIMIIQAIIRIKLGFRVRSIEKNVAEINKKLDRVLKGKK
ncbi:MAG: hypothetical protein AABW79_04535 [Nanoarchaeota archaeon]